MKQKLLLLILVALGMILPARALTYYYGEVFYETNINNMTASVIRCSEYATSIIIPDVLTVTGYGTSNGKYKVVEIEEMAFANMSNLTSVTIGANVSKIGNNFIATSGVNVISVSSSNAYFSSYGGSLFNKAQTDLICVPPKSTGRILLPTTLTTVKQYAMYAHANCTRVILPYGVKTIETGAFSNSSVEMVVLPRTVTSIGTSAFAYSKLKDLVLNRFSSPTLGTNPFTGVSGATLHVPYGYTSVYKNDSRYKTAFSTFADGAYDMVDFQGDKTYGNLGYTVVTTAIHPVRNGVTTQGIVELSYANDPLVKTPYSQNIILNGLVAQRNNAPTSSPNIAIPWNTSNPQWYIGYIGKRALARSTFTKFSCPTVEAVDSAAFQNCTMVEEVSLGTLRTIGQRAFQNCESMVYWPGNGQTELRTNGLGQYAFYNCYALEHIYLGEILEVIPDYAFYNCKALEEILYGDVEQPTNLRSIGLCAFQNCAKLKVAPLNYGIEKIAASAFTGSGIKTAVVPSTCKSFMPSAFFGCSSLTELVVNLNNPETITGVGTTPKSCRLYVPGKYYNAYAQKGWSKYFTMSSGAYDVMLPSDEGVWLYYTVVRPCEDGEDNGLLELVSHPKMKTMSLSSQNAFQATTITLPAEFQSQVGGPSTTYGDYYTVAAVGDSVFMNYTNLKNFYWDAEYTYDNAGGYAPEEMRIGDCAFYGCSNLEKCEFYRPYKIGNRAFYNCQKLTTAWMGETFMDGTNEIGNYAFYGCYALGGRIVLGGIDYFKLGQGCFGGCGYKANSKLILICYADDPEEVFESYLNSGIAPFNPLTATSRNIAFYYDLYYYEDFNEMAERMGWEGYAHPCWFHQWTTWDALNTVPVGVKFSSSDATLYNVVGWDTSDQTVKLSKKEPVGKEYIVAKGQAFIGQVTNANKERAILLEAIDDNAATRALYTDSRNKLLPGEDKVIYQVHYTFTSGSVQPRFDRMNSGNKVGGWKGYVILPSQFTASTVGVQFVSGSVSLDVNGDGSVNVGDVNYVLNLVLAEKFESKADVNSDGSVNVGDVNMILNDILSK